jgi:hypothetical protein
MNAVISGSAALMSPTMARVAEDGGSTCGVRQESQAVAGRAAEGH